MDEEWVLLDKLYSTPKCITIPKQTVKNHTAIVQVKCVLFVISNHEHVTVYNDKDTAFLQGYGAT